MEVQEGKPENKKKGIGLGATFILIISLMLIGYYVYRTIYG
jgi:hypothetical protein